MFGYTFLDELLAFGYTFRDELLAFDYTFPDELFVAFTFFLINFAYIAALLCADFRILIDFSSAERTGFLFDFSHCALN